MSWGGRTVGGEESLGVRECGEASPWAIWLREDAAARRGWGDCCIDRYQGTVVCLDGDRGHGEGWEHGQGYGTCQLSRASFFCSFHFHPGFCSQPCNNILMRETEPQRGAEVTQELCPNCLLPWQAKGGGVCQAVWSLQKPRMLLRSCGPLDLVWMPFSPCQAYPARPPAFPHLHPP